MAPIFGHVRFVGSCILGIIFAIPVALLLSSLTARKEGFLIFLFPLALAFTILIERGWTHAREKDAEWIREQGRKRYAEGKPPIGE